MRFLILFIFLASYGSLYPFDFKLNAHPGNSFLDPLWQFSRIQSLSDIVGNIVLFLPYGFLIIARKKTIPTAQIILLLLIGILFALILQILQLFTPSRDPNILDVIWNAVGIILGFLGGKTLKYRQNQNLPTSPTFSIEWLLISCWLAAQLMPFIPTLDIGLIWDNLKQFTPPFQFSLTSFLLPVSGWLLTAILLSIIFPRGGGKLFFFTVFSILFIKLILIDTSINPIAYLAGGFSLVLWQAGIGKLQSIKTILLILLLITVVTGGILPFEISPNPQSFRWVPFYGFLTGSMLSNVQNLFEKIFLYGSIIWLIPQQKKRLFMPLFVLLVTGIEFIQIYLIDHTAEITDPLLIILIAYSMKHVSNSHQEHQHTISSVIDKQTHKQILTKHYHQNPYVILTVCTILIALGLKLFMSIPHLPYNLKELFIENSLFHLFFFALFLIWFGMSGPLISKLSSFSRYGSITLIPLTVIFCAVSFFLLKASVSYESLSDILGSITIRKSIINEHLWGSTGQTFLIFPNAIDKIERYIRFIALTAPITISMCYWATVTRIVQSPLASLTPLFTQSIILGLFFLFAKLIVIDFAATDNLTELIAENGLPFIALLILTVTANASFLARKSISEQIRNVPGLMVSVVCLIVSWYLLKLGLAEKIHKYGFTFSGIDFLLGPDRKNLLSPVILFARWSLFYLSALMLLSSGIFLANKLPLAPEILSLRRSILNPLIQEIRHRKNAPLFNRTGTLISGLFIVGFLAAAVVSFIPDNTPPFSLKEKPKLPAADTLPPAKLPDFLKYHPRLPAPQNWEILQIRKHNPNFLQRAKNLGRQGQGKLYQAILTTQIQPSPEQLNNIYHQLIGLQFEGRGNVQAMPLALAYDWLYPFWSTEQKQVLKSKLVEGCQYLIDFIRDQRLSPYNVYLYNSPFQALMATSIALFQDHPQGQLCMNFTYDLWKNRVLPVWRQIMGKNGGWHEGGEYVGIGIGQAIYKVPAMWRKATGEDLFKSEPGIKGFLDFLIYRTRPDGTHMRWGDGRFFDRVIPDRLALALEYNHKAAYSLGKCPYPFQPSSIPWGALTTNQLCDPGAKNRLPLTKYFDGIGMVIARSDWTENATYITFKAGDNYWSHTHLDQGAFTIFKGGPLAIDSGLYTSDYNSDHHMNYSYQTIAHNVITVTDKDDNIPAQDKKGNPKIIANDGGQRRIGSGWGVESAPLDLNEWLKKKTLYHTGKIEKYYADDHYVVVIANITPAYTNNKSGSNTFSDRSKRVENYWRTFVYDRIHDIIMIYDDVTATKTAYTKRSIFHTINKPYLIDNTIFTHVQSRKKPNQSGGLLEATILFPQKAYINIIGGQGAEFLVQNKNYDENGKLWNSVKNRKTNPPEPGSWRVEIIPPVARKRDHFLTVYNPKLIADTQDIKIEPLETQTQIGCRIDGKSQTHSLLFNKTQHSLTIELDNGIKRKTIVLSATEL